ncbi:ABC transporter permease [Methanospirillum hungatei]|jgi:osmoprotectant transport system permease protein|uniref:ABC transporter permease n=1 Tax=Methanospirillum hungatei TaxID=2203 RepID=UPI0009D55FC7|nr:ABC transporter permease [Methanospirillum hungatei]OQA57665.1 MAG: glycine betaine transporter membrane protein [Euryarchaeota archaeon ADurb.Bin294]HOW05173.1 ABC transporter permease [Methanospirillum hungatei]
MISFTTAIIQHLTLAYSGFLISAVIGIGGAVVAVRWSLMRAILISGSSLLQSIPAFTIVALVVPFLGIGFTPAVVVVFVTTLLPVLRNATIGLSSTDPVLIDASVGMGLSFCQTIRFVRFPLAIRPIFSGLRLSSIVANSVAVVTVFIGSGGLGAIVLEGLVRFHIPGILAGVIPAMIIALLADFLLGRLEEFCAPRFH